MNAVVENLDVILRLLYRMGKVENSVLKVENSVQKVENSVQKVENSVQKVENSTAQNAEDIKCLKQEMEHQHAEKEKYSKRGMIFLTPK